MSNSYSEAVNIAREYYNSNDADNFYAIIWGGEDIHVGLYETENEPIVDASHRTVRHIANCLGDIGPDQTFLILAQVMAVPHAILQRHMVAL